MENKLFYKKVIVLYQSVWKYFYYLEAIEVRRESAAIYPEKRSHPLIWNVTIRDEENH